MEPVVSAEELGPGDQMSAEEHASLYGMDVDELAMLDPFLTNVPTPPKCIVKRLEQEDMVYRWLSPAQVKYSGMRGYITVSPTPGERKRIDEGRDTPPGVSIDEQNRIRWREDSWLGKMPRKLAMIRKRQHALRTIDQTKRALDTESLREGMARMGAKVTHAEIERWDEASEEGKR